MPPYRSQPWNPHRSWADPLIAGLLLGILLLAGFPSRKRMPASPPAAAQVTLQGRILDAALGAARSEAWTPVFLARRPDFTLASVAAGRFTGWDKAVLAVHAAEAGRLAKGASYGQEVPGTSGDAFRRAWDWAYQGTGSAPAADSVRSLGAALGNGFAARALEARLQARAGGDPAPLLAEAKRWAMARLLLWSAIGSGAVLLALAGVTFAVYLGVTPAPPRPLPAFGLSGRAVLIVVLGWFCTLLAVSPVMGLVVRGIPALTPVLIPLAYASHASLGVAYLCRAEGISLAALWRRVAPERPGPALAHGLGFFALAFAGVLAVALLFSPLLSGGEPPQRELLEYLTRFQGTWTVAVLFLTVAVLAPVFEELMFRGFLLPWLGTRLEARMAAGRARWLAAALSGLGFAVMHMQPRGLPTLATLGVILGLAFLRTGSLLTAILVHGLWNGGVFILLRTLA